MTVEPPQLLPPSILIVDDEKNMRLMLGRALENEGYQVLAASDGQQCLILCQQQLPDLILLDAVMPMMDGFACSLQLNQQFGPACPPILMITALSDPDSVERAFAAGAIDYITKPIQWSVLRQRVRRMLQTHKALQELAQAKEQIRSLTEQLLALQGNQI